jgi:glycerol kinase
MGLGLFNEDDVVSLRKADKVFSPSGNTLEMEQKYNEYKKAVRKCLLDTEEK